MTDQTTDGTKIPAPRADSGDTGGFVHRPWCLHVADGTADQPDTADDAVDGAILHHPDGDDVCPGFAATVDDGDCAVATWLIGDDGARGDVTLVVSGTARYRRRTDVATLIRELTERMQLMPA